VTAVITVKTHSPVSWKYQMPNRRVSLGNCTTDVFTAPWSQIWQFWR